MNLRRMIVVGVLASLVVPANTNAIESGKIDTPVIATLGQGSLLAVWSQPVGQPIADEYSLEVCHGSDCVVEHSSNTIPYTPNSSASRTSITAFFSVSAPNNPSLFFIRNKDLPLTATIWAGSSAADSSRSDPSAYFYLEKPEYSPIDTTQQFLQPVLNSLSSHYLSMGFCFNRTSDAFRRPNDGNSDIGLRFPEAFMKVEVSKDGTVIQSRTISSRGDGVQGDWFNGRYCEDGTEGDERFEIYDPGYWRGNRNANSLDAGTTYTFTFSVFDGSSQIVSGSLDVTTPGGCPSTPPGPPQFLVKSGWSALIDSSGYYLTLFQGFSPRQSAYMSAKQSANLYVSPYKTFPYNSSFVYVPEIDDFAMDMSNLSTSGKYQIKDATIFKDCSSEQVQIAASTADFRGKSDDRACQIVEGNIIPTRVGRCILRVQITRRASVTASGVRKMGFAFTRDLAVNFSSLSTTMPSSNTASSATTAIANTVAVKTGRSQALSTLAKAAQLSIPKGAKVSGVVSQASGAVCQVLGPKVVGIAPGKCTVTIRVKPKNGKVTNKSMSINIVGSPTVKRGASISLVNAAAAAGLTTGGLSVKATIATSSTENCKVSGSKIIGVKVGRCSANMTVTSSSGATQAKIVTIKVK